MSRDDRQKRRSRVDTIGCQNDAGAEWGDSNLQGFPPTPRLLLHHRRTLLGDPGTVVQDDVRVTEILQRPPGARSRLAGGAGHDDPLVLRDPP